MREQVRVFSFPSAGIGRPLLRSLPASLTFTPSSKKIANSAAHDLGNRFANPIRRHLDESFYDLHPDDGERGNVERQGRQVCVESQSPA
jgi:hypothetical protein